MTQPISTRHLLSPLPTAYCLEWKKGVFHILTPDQFRNMEHKWEATVFGLYEAALPLGDPRPFCFIHNGCTIITRFSVITMNMGDVQMKPLFLGPALHDPVN